MARLLSTSDLDELREVVKRWVGTAATHHQERVFQNFAARIVELKQEIVRMPRQPSAEELTALLTMMLRLAAQSEGGAPPRR
jgi:hypothetical protein